MKDEVFLGVEKILIALFDCFSCPFEATVLDRWLHSNQAQGRLGTDTGVRKEFRIDPEFGSVQVDSLSAQTDKRVE